MNDTIDGVTLEKAMEVHRLYRRDFLNAQQIAKITGINLAMVAGILSGQYFEHALWQWESVA